MRLYCCLLHAIQKNEDRCIDFIVSFNTEPTEVPTSQALLDKPSLKDLLNVCHSFLYFVCSTHRSTFLSQASNIYV